MVSDEEYNSSGARFRQVEGAPVGLYRRKESRFWWISYTVEGVQRFQSTKTTSKQLAGKIWKKREGEIALGLFKVGWPGERMSFAQLSEEFIGSHTSTLSAKSQRNHQLFIKNLRAYFGERLLVAIDQRLVEKYRDYRRRQPSRRDPKRTVKGATVNRELECLQCMFQFAVTRRYISESPAARVKHFDERRERPAKRMLTVEQEQKILAIAPPYLRVGIILLVQTGGRTYSEGFSLRWDQVDLDSAVIHLNGEVKTEASAQPVPLTALACQVLKRWQAELNSTSPYVFPSLRDSSKPIGSVKRVWRTTLRKAGVPYLPIYHLRHVFCTRLSWVAPDTIIQRAMRHASPETKQCYQLGMVDEVRENMEQANRRVYRNSGELHFYDSEPTSQKGEAAASRN
jgi:integrase